VFKLRDSSGALVASTSLLKKQRCSSREATQSKSWPSMKGVKSAAVLTMSGARKERPIPTVQERTPRLVVVGRAGAENQRAESLDGDAMK